jgi:hypothetical protein
MGSEAERIERMYPLGPKYGGGLCVVLIVSFYTVMCRLGLTGIDVEDGCRDVEWFRVFSE